VKTATARIGEAVQSRALLGPRRISVIGLPLKWREGNRLANPRGAVFND